MIRCCPQQKLRWGFCCGHEEMVVAVAMLQVILTKIQYFIRNLKIQSGFIIIQIQL